VLRSYGRGTAPYWSADGSLLLFERTEDDGHEIVASDLYAVDLDGGCGVMQITATDTQIERRPAIAPDGKSIAFDDDAGSIFTAPIERVPCSSSP
jgi:Tol biopolymer transport system component